jgi:hypothetical protein
MIFLIIGKFPLARSFGAKLSQLEKILPIH